MHLEPLKQILIPESFADFCLHWTRNSGFDRTIATNCTRLIRDVTRATEFDSNPVVELGESSRLRVRH